jgi:hypothetical protein
MKLEELCVGEPAVKYKSEALLRSESKQIDAWLSAEMKRIDRVVGLAKAVIFSDHSALAKGAGSDIVTARADVAALRKRYAKECEKFGDGFISGLAPAHRLATVLAEYVQRTEAHKEDVARSRRFNKALQALPLTSVLSNAVN